MTDLDPTSPCENKPNKPAKSRQEQYGVNEIIETCTVNGESTVCSCSRLPKPVPVFFGLSPVECLAIISQFVNLMGSDKWQVAGGGIR